MLQLRLNLVLVPTHHHHHHIHFHFHYSSPSPLLCSKTQSLSMADKDSGDSSKYQHALSHLSSLITTRTSGDGSNRGDRFHLMSRYLNILELDQPLKDLKVIHVAGTKGKGSTCSFAESILRNCGFTTGLFTSPHLIDVRERFRLDGVEISEEKFLKYFWWCWDRLQEKTDDGFPMPTYFRFLALLAFKIFSAEQVDVAILEVGLGGRFDATNVVQVPVVCGVASLGYDHMQILGNTLGQIAGEKAGIFKEKVPAYTVPQPEEAMSILEEKASKLGIPLHVSQPLDSSMLNGHKLGLDGEHQFVNAGLAVSLCRTWLKKTGHADSISLDDMSLLPEQFIRGLAMTKFPGRAQTVPDPKIGIQHQGTLNPGGLTFYLDGAHSPESMEMCARWFCNVIAKDARQHSEEQTGSCQDSENILLFNCMSVRDPQLLLPRLLNVCADNGVYFRRALFVPNQSSYNKVGSHASPANDSLADDLSWQQTLQRVWENLVHGEKAPKAQRFKAVNTMKSDDGTTAVNPNYPCRQANSSVLPSLPLAIKWIRDTAQQNRTVRFQVLVTGSLHLVGDVLRLIKK